MQQNIIMKKRIAILTISLIALLSACRNPVNHDEMPNDTAASPQEITDVSGVSYYYECPMKCDDKKFSEEGHCPVCNMNITKVTVAKDNTRVENDTVFQ